MKAPKNELIKFADDNYIIASIDRRRSTTLTTEHVQICRNRSNSKQLNSQNVRRSTYFNAGHAVAIVDPANGRRDAAAGSVCQICELLS